MSFSVIWLAPALKELAELWMAAPDRDAVGKASDAIDDFLRQSPLDVGESREGATRILFHDPLAVYYAVSESEAPCICLGRLADEEVELSSCSPNLYLQEPVHAQLRTRLLRWS